MTTTLLRDEKALSSLVASCQVNAECSWTASNDALIAMPVTSIRPTTPHSRGKRRASSAATRNTASRVHKVASTPEMTSVEADGVDPCARSRKTTSELISQDIAQTAKAKPNISAAASARRPRGRHDVSSIRTAMAASHRSSR